MNHRFLSLCRKRLLVAPVLVALATLMHAQPASADAADDAFTKGQEHAEKGELPEAEAAFEAAWTLRKAWDIAGNLGLVEAARGKNVEAAEHLEYAIKHIGGLAESEQKAGLEKRFAEVRSKVAAVDITAPEGCEIRIGKQDRGRAPLATSAYIEPGAVTVTATQEGFEPFEITVTVEAGASMPVRVSLKAKGNAGPGPEATDDKALWPAILLGGVGAAGLGVGIGLTVAGSSSYSDAEALAASDACASPAACQAQGEDLIGDADLLSNIGIAGFAVGGAGLAAMVIYLVIPSGEADASAVSLVPVFGPRDAGLHATLRF